MRRPVALALVPALLLGLLGLAACAKDPNAPGPGTEESGKLSGVKVSGAVGAVPEVRIDAPLDPDRTASKILVEGSGSPVQIDQKFVLELTLVDGRTGKQVASTYDAGKTAMALRTTDDTVFPVLLNALNGVKQGSRVVVISTSDDAYGDSGAPQLGIRPGDPVVMIGDVIAVPPTEVLDGPEGTAVKEPAKLPRPVLAGDDVTGVDFTRIRKRKPKKLVVVPLIKGTGPPARETSLVTLDYLGQVWRAKAPFESTFAKEPTTVSLGTGSVIRAWDQALAGVTRGSRVLVIAPPALAFKTTGSPPSIPGNATLVYVIDVLGVS